MFYATMSIPNDLDFAADYLGHKVRKSYFDACKQYRCRSDAQSDQCHFQSFFQIFFNISRKKKPVKLVR